MRATEGDMETIIIRKTPAGCTATFTDPSVRELFSTDTLPTPYRATADAEYVRREIERLNPECDVVMLSKAQIELFDAVRSGRRAQA